MTKMISSAWVTTTMVTSLSKQEGLRQDRRRNPHLLSAHARQYLTRSFVRRSGIHVFPKRPLDAFRRDPNENFYNSLDPQWLRFTAELADVLTARFPRRENSEGEVDPKYGITGNFQRLRTVAGYTPPVFSCPQASSERARKDAGVADPPQYGKHRLFTEIVDMVVDEVIGHMKPSTVRVKNHSHPGLPGTTSNRVAFKRAIIQKVLAHGTHEYYTTLAVSSFDTRTRLYHETGANYSGIIIHRGQFDSVSDDGKESKKRVFFSPRVARGEEAWKDEYYDKTVVLHGGRVVPGHFAERVRIVVAPNFVMNLLGQVADAQVRSGIFAASPFTFHHRGLEDLRNKVKDWRESVSIDGSQWDSLSPAELYDAIADSMARHFDERYILFIKYMLRIQMVMHCPDDTGQPLADPVFGSPYAIPRSLAEMIFAQLPSGDFFTSSFGKIGGSIAILWNFVLAGLYMKIEDLRAIWRGVHPEAAFVNMTDDNHVGFKSLEAKEQKRKFIEALPRNPYAKWEVDANNSFGGQLISTYGGATYVSPRINGLIENSFGRERPLSQKTPETIAIGMQARLQVYSEAAQYDDVLSTTNEVMRKHLGVRYETVANSITVSPSAYADALFLEDPSVIHYKVDPEDVTPELMDTKFTSIDAATAARAMAWIIKDPDLKRRFSYAV